MELKFIGFYASPEMFDAIKTARNKLNLNTKSEVLRLAVTKFLKNLLKENATTKPTK